MRASVSVLAVVLARAAAVPLGLDILGQTGSDVSETLDEVEKAVASTLDIFGDGDSLSLPVELDSDQSSSGKRDPAGLLNALTAGLGFGANGQGAGAAGAAQATVGLGLGLEGLKSVLSALESKATALVGGLGANVGAGAGAGIVIPPLTLGLGVHPSGVGNARPSGSPATPTFPTGSGGKFTPTAPTSTPSINTNRPTQPLPPTPTFNPISSGVTSKPTVAVPTVRSLNLTSTSLSLTKASTSASISMSTPSVSIPTFSAPSASIKTPSVSTPSMKTTPTAKPSLDLGALGGLISGLPTFPGLTLPTAKPSLDLGALGGLVSGLAALPSISFKTILVTVDGVGIACGPVTGGVKTPTGSVSLPHPTAEATASLTAKAGAHQ